MGTPKDFEKLETRLDAFNDAIGSIRSMYYATISPFSHLEKERIRQKHSTPLEKKLEKDLAEVILRDEGHRQEITALKEEIADLKEGALDI